MVRKYIEFTLSLEGLAEREIYQRARDVSKGGQWRVCGAGGNPLRGEECRLTLNPQDIKDIKDIKVFKGER
ncbi:hypothetical protein GCM10009567_13550 [Rothia amarae]